jgi:hypothetical protein
MCHRCLNCIRFLVDDENGSPLFANSCAVAEPMPPAPPVMIAAFPDRRSVI